MRKQNIYKLERQTIRAEDGTADVQNSNFNSPLPNSNPTTVALIERSLQNIKKKNQEGQLRLKLPSHINPQQSPKSQISGIDGTAFKFAPQSLSRQNSKKTLKYLQQQTLNLPQRNRISNLNHFQPTETHLSVLGKTKLSPQQRNAETQIIKTKLVKLNSLPYRVMRRIKNEEIREELQKNMMDMHAIRNQSINDQQYSSLLETSQITDLQIQNQADQFQRLKEQFWQQANIKNYSTISQQQQNIYGGPSVQSTTIQQDSLLQNSVGPSQSLYNKINFGKKTGKNFTLNLPEDDHRRFGQRKAESVNTSRSHTNSPNRAPKLTKLIYKMPSPGGSQLQGGSYRLQYPGNNFNSSMVSTYQTIAHDQSKLPELFNQTQTRPAQTPMSQFGGGNVFLTGANIFEPQQKVEQEAKEINLLNRMDQDKSSLKINTNFITKDNLQKDYGMTPLRKNDKKGGNNFMQQLAPLYDSKPLRTTSMIESFGEIEKRLLSEIADCTVCQEKFKRFIKQHTDSQSQVSIDYQLISVESSHSVQQQRATFRDRDHNSTQLVSQMANALEKKIVDAKSLTLQNKFDQIKRNLNQESKVSSLPRISDKRGSKADLLSELNKAESHQSLSGFHSKKRNSVEVFNPANTDYLGLIEHYKHHLHSLFHQNENSMGAEEDDSNKLIMDLVQDDMQLSSFLVKQQEKVLLRESIKEQFEKDSNVDQEEFQRMLLFPSTSSMTKQAKDKKKKTIEESEVSPLMKSSMLGGLSLKIKEKLMKNSENENMTRFYDFLLSVRERENFLSQNLRDIIKPKYQEKTQEWMIEYLKECEKQHTVPLALAATQIKNSHYFLNDYQLNEGVVKALCQSINLSEEKLSKLTLSQNQISDSQFALLLASLNQRQVNTLKSIIYCNLNEFGPKSYEILKSKYLSKYVPNQMEELRIVNCKVSAGVINNILGTLKETCFLKRLSLPRCRLSDQSLDILAYLINKNQAPQLIELDISWNGISVNSLNKIFKSLQTNTNLQTLNLSWNEVKESVDITPLCQFISHNTSLVHLDLSKMFNSPKQLKRILKSIKKSLSLQAVHFANTPTLVNDQRLFTYMLKKLRAKQTRDKKYKKPNIFQLYKNDWRSQMKTQFLMNEGEKELQEYSCYNLSQAQLAADPSSIQENLILQRALGHPEIEGSSQWQVKSGKGDYRDCFVCGRWQYTIFMRMKERSNEDQSQISLANPLSAIMGGATQNSSHSILMKKSTMMHEQLITDSTLHVKIKGSYESFRNFKTQQMMNILKFAQILDPSYVSAEQKFEESLKAVDPSTLSLITKNHIIREQKFYEVRKEVENYYKENWKNILQKQIKYKNIQFVPENFTFQNCDETLYVFADFVKPTNQLEQLNISEQPSHLFFPQVRRDELSLISIKGREQKFEDRNVNVFADWKVDTEQTLDDMLEIDVKYWKVQKFIKDKKDYEKVLRVIRGSLREIKDIYISLICQSNYPNLGWLDFARFIQQCCILDDNTQMVHIDLMFIAANVEAVDIQENPNKSLCRYEFLELLVRIAAHKFKDADLTETYSDALERLLQSYILRYYQPLAWQLFREEELWVREVNLVLDANLDSLQKLFKKYWQPKQSWLSVQDALALMIKDMPQLELAHIEVIQAYGMSQMTVKNEMEKGVNPYTKLVFVEFLEFFCRCASIKYKQSADLLYRKVERLLDQILPLVNCIRKDFVRKVEIIQAESDESILSEQLFENLNDMNSYSEDRLE